MVALADGALEGVVDQGEDMVRPAQDRHIAGGLPEQRVQVCQLGPEGVAGPRVVHPLRGP